MTWDVIKYPHVTEKAMNDMDFQNKLQFVVDDQHVCDPIGGHLTTV